MILYNLVLVVFDQIQRNDGHDCLLKQQPIKTMLRYTTLPCIAILDGQFQELTESYRLADEENSTHMQNK
jgi:hypothetical protein